MLLRAIELEGGRVILGHSNHWKVYRPGGRGGWRYVATVSSSPSDGNGRRQAVRQLRREGFALEGFH